MTLKSLISNAWRFSRWHWRFWFQYFEVFSVDNLCGEIYVTKYVYVDSEEYLNLFKYDCFYTLLFYTSNLHTHHFILYLLLHMLKLENEKFHVNMYRYTINCKNKRFWFSKLLSNYTFCQQHYNILHYTLKFSILTKKQFFFWDFQIWGSWNHSVYL